MKIARSRKEILRMSIGIDIVEREARMSDDNIQVEITDPTEFHCFRLVFNPRSAPGQRIEIMLHATQLVDLLHRGNVALCEWQQTTSQMLLERIARKQI